MQEQHPNQTDSKSTRKQTNHTLLGWIIGIFFLLSGVILLLSAPLSSLFSILAGLVIFPPFWKVMRNKWSLFPRRKYKIVLCLVFFFISVALSGQGSNQTNVTTPPTASVTRQVNALSVATSTPKLTPTPTKPLTLEEKIKDKIKLDGDIKVTDLSIEPDEDLVTHKSIPGKVAVLITYRMDGTYLDTSWAKRGSWSIDTNIIKDVFPIDTNINTVVMLAEVPVTTAYGKDDYDTLNSVTIGRDTYAQINFPKFDTQNLPTIADYYMENQKIK